MRRPATWSGLLLCLLLIQAFSPLTAAWSSSEKISVTQEDTDAPLYQLSKMNISPISDSAHGWGSLDDSLLPVWLVHRNAAPVAVSNWVEETGQRTVEGWVVLQHEWPVPSDWFSNLSAAGIECYSFLPPANFHCDVPKMSPNELDELDVIGIMKIDPTDKIRPALVQAMTTGPRGMYASPDGATMNLMLSGTEIPEIPDMTVFSHDGRFATVATNPAGVKALAENEAIEWLEEKPFFLSFNDIGRDLIGVDFISDTSSMNAHTSGWTGMDGTGIIVTVADSGLDNGVDNMNMHPDFRGDIDGILAVPMPQSVQGSTHNCASACSYLYDDGAADEDSGHGTHVSGSVLGDGTASSGVIVGSAPGATLLFQAVEIETHWVSAPGCAGCTNPGFYFVGIPDDVGDLMEMAAENHSLVHTNSWGSPNAGEYTTSSAQADAAAVAYANMSILFAAGNDGVDMNGDGEIDLDSTGSPATAKNVITVGATENGRTTLPVGSGPSLTPGVWGGGYGTPISTDQTAGQPEGMAAFSSRGPTDDLRQKPDVSAPGTYILSTRSRDTTDNGWLEYDSDHVYMGGTSMATPLTAGAAAALLQHLKDNVGHDNPSSALVKAMFAAGAMDMAGQYSSNTNGAGEAAPNIHEGWGRANLTNSVNASFVDWESVSTSDTRKWTFAVPANTDNLSIMLSWTDPASTSIAAANLVNELDLKIKKPDGSWINDANTVDNLIGEIITNPPSGTWEVHVEGASVPTGPQAFALALSRNFTLANLTQDADVDGIEDSEDDCVNTFGNSTVDRKGCPDTDGDGYSNPDGTAPAHPTGSADAFPSDATQWENTDGDAYGDNPAGTNPDDCISVVGTSTIDRIGCPDGDGDGYSTADATWTTAQGADDCDSVIGNSTIDRNGCLDTDGDGYSNPDGSSAAHPVGTADALPNEKTQWEDTDGDGFGDNWANTSWTVTREAASTQIGIWVLNAYQPDECEIIFGSSIHDRIGCPDNDNDGYSNPDATHLAHPNGNADAFPTEPSQWNDTDGDGFGDNPAGTNADDCPSVSGSSIEIGSLGCPDTDGDGTPDNVDDFPNEVSQDTDTDSDGYGDDAAGYEGDDCPSVSGTSFQDGTYGCLDSDLDGYADIVDAFPNEITQWNDTDGDGFGDNAAGYQGDGCPTATGSSSIDTLGCPDSDGDGYSDDGDAFSETSSQWRDSDGDGYGDNPSPAELYDECPTVWGNSSSDRQGCFDSDGDGYSNPSGGWDATDGADAFPNDKLRWVDDDGDGFDDDLEDACDSSAGNSTIDRKGCLDSDGDGYSDAGNGWSPSDGADAFPNVASQWSDADGDGYGDNPYGLTADDCIAINGNSTIDRTGCLDSDGDGYSNANATHLAHPDGTADAFPNDSSQWEDADGDGYGDRLQGTTPDDCPTVNGDSSIGKYGCIDSDGDGVPNAIEGTWTILLGADAFPDDDTQWKDADVDGYGDNPGGTMGDACPTQQGDSDQGGKYGCIDSDGDGWGDEYDDLPTIGSQWLDSDGDGYGDNVTTGALMIDHWPSDENKNVAEVYLTCTPNSLTGDPNEAIDITITCTVTNQISIPLVVVVRWDFTQGITASMVQRPVNLGASGATDGSISITFTGRASYTENIDSTILVMEPGGTKNLDIESFVVNINAPPIVTTNITNDDDVVNQSWSKYIPIDPNDASMTLPFFGSIVLVMLFIARRISVKGRKGFNTMSDVAKKNVEQSRVSLTRSSSVLERPPPPLPPNFNIK